MIIVQPIRILHLSDVHFDASKAWDADPVLWALTKFIDGEVARGLKPDLVAITGDLAFSGKVEEYALATRWLKERLWPVLGGDLPYERLLLVPGNHDVNRVLIRQGAKLIQKGLLDSKSQDDIANVLRNKDERQILLDRHAAYLDFVGRWFDKPQDLSWWERLIVIRGIRLHVSGLNSAWIASDDSDRSNLLLGRYQISQTVLAEQANKADWRIALMHHPWDCLAEFDCHEARAAIHQHCDFLLRGHLHSPHTERILPPDPTRSCLELAAGCIYETSKYPNAFQWIELSPVGKRVSVHYRAWLHSAWTIDRNQPNCPDGHTDFHLGGEAITFSNSYIMVNSTSQPSTRPAAKFVVVKLPNVENEDLLFVARPLSSEFNALQAAIEKAARYTQMTPLCFNKTFNDQGFFQDVESSIHTARVVAAVCTPENDNQLPNANVMYQLGFAQSIGKSTIILIADSISTPDALYRNNIVLYKPGEESTQAFLDNLIDRLNSKKLQTPNKTTDRTYEPNIVCAMSPPLLLDSRQWHCILEILTFCKNIHHNFQALAASHIENLCNLIDRLLDDPHTSHLPDRQNACIKAWNNYSLHYDRIWRSDIEPMLSDSRVVDAFKLLLAEPDNNTIKKPFLIQNAAFFQDLFVNLKLYPETHEAIKECIASPPYNRNMVLLLGDLKAATLLAGYLTQLSTASKSVITYADSLIRNIISLLHTSFVVGQ